MSCVLVLVGCELRMWALIHSTCHSFPASPDPVLHVVHTTSCRTLYSMHAEQGQMQHRRRQHLYLHRRHSLHGHDEELCHGHLQTHGQHRVLHRAQNLHHQKRLLREFTMIRTKLNLTRAYKLEYATVSPHAKRHVQSRRGATLLCELLCIVHVV